VETSEQLPHGAVEAHDLAELVRRPGPFVSLYLRTERDVENAAQRSHTRWKTVRSDLGDRGAPTDILDEMDPLVPDTYLVGDCLAVIADAERILHVEHGPAVSQDDIGTWGPLPHLLPILRWRQTDPTYVVVLTDRTGADLFGIRRGSPELHGEVEGEHDVIRKVQAGGWSQRRYQQRAEDSWEQNAEQVADRVTRLADRIEPEFVAVAGDVRAVALLRESLPERVDELVHVIEKEIPRKLGEDDPVPEDVWALVQQHVRERTEALLARFEEERGQHDKAVEGADATARALAMSQVAVLLIAGEPLADRTLWFGPDPASLAATDRELKDLGVDSPEEGPAGDVLVRAALGTGAGIRVLDDAGPIREGVGALLRWTSA
jgi:Bacterial archaeo-eukaryotic release factor family 2